MSFESRREKRMQLMFSSHVSCKPGQCTPLRREGPGQLVCVEAPARRERGQGGAAGFSNFGTSYITVNAHPGSTVPVAKSYAWSAGIAVLSCASPD